MKPKKSSARNTLRDAFEADIYQAIKAAGKECSNKK